jgi:hypothetical protein
MLNFGMLRILLDYFITLVGRGIIQQYNLKIPVGLGQHRFNALFQEFRVIVIGYDYRDFGFIHFSLPEHMINITLFFPIDLCRALVGNYQFHVWSDAFPRPDASLAEKTH